MAISVDKKAAPEAEVEFGQDVLTFPVKYMSPSAIKPYFRNAKRHDRRQITLLGKAIRTSGFDQPIVVDKDLVIIKGHARRLASLEIHLDLVPVVVRSDLTEDQCMASRIADNQVSTMTQVDKAMEQQEIADYVKAGGHDAAIFFDFMDSSHKPSSTPAGATHPTTPKAKAPTIAGTLETCPKCNHTFNEVHKK